MHEFGVLDPAERQPDARIKKRRVDTVGIHVGDARVRIESALLAFPVCHRVVADHTVTGADRAERAKTSASAKSPAVDAQTLLAVVVDKQARCPVTKARIDVVLPQIQRLQDVAVGIDDIVGATHDPVSFRVNDKPENQTLVWLEGRYAAPPGLSTRPASRADEKMVHSRPITR